MSGTSASEASASSTDDSPNHISTIAEFRAEYRKADLFCQEVQSFVNSAGVPAINELRNAGQHLLAAIDDQGAIRSQIDLNAGTAHCRRACYEAYEMGILTALLTIEKFKDDYRTVTAGDVIPDYADILVAAQEAQRAVEVGRHPEFDRAQDHTHRMDAFRRLRQCADRVTVAREEMNKKVDAATTAARASAKNLAIGAVGLAVAIIGLLIAIWQLAGLRTPWGDESQIEQGSTRTPPAPGPNPAKDAR